MVASKFIALTITALSAVIFGVSVMPAPVAAPEADVVELFHILTHEEMMHLLANTDAKLTYVGEPINPLAPRTEEDTTVTYCSNRSGRQCLGSCTVYSGRPICLYAPDTNCLSATHNVIFCSGDNCNGPCTELNNCREQLANGFCETTNTNSIQTLY